MTRRRSTARRAPARGGQQGYEPPVTRMRRDERLLELVVERWSQRQIAAEVGLTQGGVSKALRRIFTRQQATLTQEAEAYRTKLVLLAERRARAAREGHARSQADVTTRRQRKVAAGGGATATTVVELETQSAAGNPTYLAVEQRCDEFAAHLVGVYDSPALPVGALPPALDPTSANVRLLGHLSTDLIERAHAELTRPPDPRPAESDPA